MKKAVLLLILLLPVLAKGQMKLVDSFEHWRITPFTDLLPPWHTSNDSFITKYSVISVKKVAGSGSVSAVRIETFGASDTIAGYIKNTKGDPLKGEGGVPYSQKPTALEGLLRYSVNGGDSGVVMAIFKKGGVVIGSNMFKVNGSQPSFIPFSLMLTMPQVPDSMILVASSSNIFKPLNARMGSWLELDELHFSGPGVTQIINNGNFENWAQFSNEGIDGWACYGNVTRTTDKYSGDYAAQLVSEDEGTGVVEPANMVRPIDHNTSAVDTLIGYYKYSAPTPDSGFIITYGKRNSVIVGNGGYLALPPAASYTQFKIPISVKETHDSLTVDVLSSISQYPSAGGTLIIDQLELKRQSVGVNKVLIGRSTYSVYPNPASDVVMISSNASMIRTSINILNSAGQLVAHTEVRDNTDHAEVNISHLSPGIYNLVLRDVNGSIFYTHPVARQ